jgi:hypothetical protein
MGAQLGKYAGHHQGEIAMVKDEAVTLEEAAKQLKISPLSLLIWQAAGCPGPETENYCPMVDTLDEVAGHFGVNRRTISEWRAKGIVSKSSGKYNLVDIRFQRLKYLDEHGKHPSTAELTGHPALDERVASGELARAILRFYSTEIRRAAFLAFSEAISECEKGKSPLVRSEAVCRASELLAPRLSTICLDEEQIRQVVKDCWALV